MGARLAYAGAVGWAGRRRESRGASVEVGGTMVTPVAHERAMGLRVGPAAVLVARSAPARIEVRRADGSRHDIAVNDVEWRLRQASVMLTALLLIVTILGRFR